MLQSSPESAGQADADHPVRFRDPPLVDAEASELRLEIAKTLVGAPRLPVALSAHGLRLLTVEVDRRGIDLVVGFEDPVARLRMLPIQALGSAASRAGPVTVTVVDVGQRLERVAQTLAKMAERVGRSTTAERWTSAWATARKLASLPSSVALPFFREVVAGLDPARAPGLVRTGFRCNQDCGMCWQSRNWGSHGPAQVLRWIEDIRAAGLSHLIVSGGEPTLDPALTDYLRHARAIGFRSVVIETNAIQASKDGLARKLADAGLACAFVSLHSADAATSDLITRAPGTHARTVRGIHAFLEAGVDVVLNAVATRQGLDHLASLPDFIHQEFGGAIKSLMLSYPTLPFDETLLPSILPEPDRLRTTLKATIERACAVGLPVRGLDGPCGPALCAFGADRRVTDLQPIPHLVPFRQHLPACDGCAVKYACLGVRVVDVQHFGESCVEPLEQLPA